LTPSSRGSSLWRRDMTKPAKNTICLWYDGDAEDAARFYAKTFPDSSFGAVHRSPGDLHSWDKGDVLTVELTVMGVLCIGLNGEPVVSLRPGLHSCFARRAALGAAAAGELVRSAERQTEGGARLEEHKNRPANPRCVPSRGSAQESITAPVRNRGAHA